MLAFRANGPFLSKWVTTRSHADPENSAGHRLKTETPADNFLYMEALDSRGTCAGSQTLAVKFRV